jgi:hypothetical protein
MTAPLPKLLDAAALADELGIPRSAAWAIMRAIPTVRPEGLRKVYVKREDVEAYLARCTVTEGKVA